MDKPPEQLDYAAAAPLAPSAPRIDRFSTAMGMALTALYIGIAINLDLGNYSHRALGWITLAAIICILAVVLSAIKGLEDFCRRYLSPLLAVGVAFQAGLILHEFGADARVAMGVAAIAVLGILQATNLRNLRVPLIFIMMSAFCLMGAMAFNEHALDPDIDVYIFQQDSSLALLNGKNPYAIRFPNIYLRDTPFYGPGVVDEHNWLTYGFPYPPFSLLMTLPARLAGDVRYAHVVAMALSAMLMAFARPGRWGALAATLFLLTPRAFYVMELGWTEPLLTFNFSLVMFCACRWRKALPYALGLFFATKQYTVLALPAMLLLVDGPNPWKQLWDLALRAGLVVAAITLPFVLWNPHEFIRAVVLWQLVQPFRRDALSYLNFIYDHNGNRIMPVWTPLLAVIPATALALWRLRRTPAAFAAAVTFINFAFFAFNKQAFCNYYYFVIATACWAVAATAGGHVSKKTEQAPGPAPLDIR
jgi:hypothetical protein